MLGSIAWKNYERSLLNSVLKPRNEMVQVALGVSFLTVINGLLWLALGKGIIINIFQQALTVVFELSVFQYALKIFDPLQRWISRDLVKKCCNLVKLILGLVTLVLAVLIRVKDVYGLTRLENNYNYIALYFLIIDFILVLVVCYFIWVFCSLYIQVRRGINYNSSEEEKEAEIFDLRKRWVIDDINLDDFSHVNDPNCLNALKLEKIMIERFIFFFFLVFSMNLYKLSWGSSQFECSSRVSCSPSITERNFQRAINSLSYWMPDLISMVVWLLLLVRPCGDQVALPEERMSWLETETGAGTGTGTRAEGGSADDQREPSFDSDSSPGIKLSIISNPISTDSNESASFRDLHNNKAKCTSTNVPQEFREIAVSCEEMILFHRESGIPVATLFAGKC